MTRACSDCGKAITPSSKKGRCRSCACTAMNADRDLIARRTATMHGVRADAGYRDRHAEACRAAKVRMMEDPVALEKLRKAGREVGSKNFWIANTPESREKARVTLQRKRLAWCPERYWPLNAELKRAGMRLEERKHAIAQQQQVDERARRAAMTPFERQMDALNRGARLIEVPRSTRTEPTMTLGGVPSGLL